MKPVAPMKKPPTAWKKVLRAVEQSMAVIQVQDQDHGSCVEISTIVAGNISIAILKVGQEMSTKLHHQVRGRG